MRGRGGDAAVVCKELCVLCCAVKLLPCLSPACSHSSSTPPLLPCLDTPHPPSPSPSFHSRHDCAQDQGRARRVHAALAGPDHRRHHRLLHRHHHAAAGGCGGRGRAGGGGGRSQERVGAGHGRSRRRRFVALTALHERLLMHCCFRCTLHCTLHSAAGAAHRGGGAVHPRRHLRLPHRQGVLGEGVVHCM